MINSNKRIRDDLNFDSYVDILKMTAIDIIQCKDLVALSCVISGYFANNLEKSSCNLKLVLKIADNKYEKIKLNHDISFGIRLKDFAGSTILSKLKKVIDSNAVYKKLHYIYEIYKEVYFFSRSKCSYITDYALRKFEKKQLRRNAFLTSSVYFSSSSNFYILNSLSTTQKIKAKEFHSTCMQLDELAAETSKCWLSVTISSPSIFHINPVQNLYSWDGIVTPKDSNNLQNKIWQDTFRQLSKKNINPFGHWVKEVNRSSAIHRHGLIYCSESEIDEIKKWLLHYTKSAYKKINCNFIEDKSIHFESGAINEVHVTGAMKSTVIANYINKSILFCLNSNEDSSKNKKINNETVSKALAHADKYKYRRYGFFGLKGCLTTWRMLKYISKNIRDYEVTKPLKKLTDFALSNQFSKFLRSPEVNQISIIYEEDDKNSYVKKYSEKVRKPLGLKLMGVSFYIKERYYSLYEKIIDLIRINIFLELTR